MPYWKDADGTERRALSELGDFAGKRVLEVGCGDGRLTWTYADKTASVFAFDSSEEAIAQARAGMPSALRSRVELAVGRIESIDVPEHSFDVVLLTRSL